MRAFIQCDFTEHPCNSNAFMAFDGLRAMGYECVFFQRYEELIVGSIGIIKRRLQDFRIECLKHKLSARIKQVSRKKYLEINHQ